MKDFFLNLSAEVQHLLMYSVRGMTLASVILLLTIIVDSIMPKEVAFLNNYYISLEPYHLALYAIGGIYAVQIFIVTWIKDYKREYLPHWLLG